MNLSACYNLKIGGHKDLDFIDIDHSLDTKLFLDPYVIQAVDTDFCIEARKAIDSFFKEVFSTCRSRNTNRLRELLKHATEPNETNLGMKLKSDYGKGATAKTLSKLFLDFYKIVNSNPYIESDPLALCMYIKFFDKDKMSDLVTNIIRNQLYQFTEKQCEKWNISLESEKKSIGYYWDYELRNWKELHANPLILFGNQVLLVPKYIVRTRYVFNVECYIKQYILSTMQEEHLSLESDFCTTKEYSDGRKVVTPPTKKELYNLEVVGKNHKGYAFSHSVGYKEQEDKFYKDILRRIADGYGTLADSDLDKIVYKHRNKRESA